MVRILTLCLLAIFLLPCEAKALPKPAKSEYFETEGAGFLVKRGEGLFYAMTYKVKAPFDRPVYGTVTFQNPISKGNETVNKTV